MEWYRPGAVILQCGADSLAGDKLGGFNLSMKGTRSCIPFLCSWTLILFLPLVGSGHANCVRYLATFGVPLMLVGGGGYTTKVSGRGLLFTLRTHWLIMLGEVSRTSLEHGRTRRVSS